MNRLLKLSFLSLLTIVMMSSAEKSSNAAFFANNKINNIYLGVGVGTTGGYVEAAYYFKNFVGIRAEFAGVPRQVFKSVEDKMNNLVGDAIRGVGVGFDSVSAQSKLNMLSWGFDASVRPLGGAWRLDAGIRSTNISVDLDFTANKTERSGSMESKGDAHFVFSKGWRPYFGTGWDWNPVVGFTISLSLGVIYTIDSWELSANASSKIKGGFSADDQKELEVGIKDLNLKSVGVGDVQKYLKVWPVVKFGVGYSFKF